MGAFTEITSKLAYKIDKFTEATGNLIAWLNIGMVVFTVLVVVLRYAFNSSSIALQESVTYLHGIVFLIGSAYTLKHDEHVRVDILYQNFSPKGKAIVNLLGTLLLLLPIMFYIAIESWPYVLQSWQVMEVSDEAAGLPAVFLLKTLVLLMVAVLSLQGIAELLKSALIIIAPESNSNNNDHRGPDTPNSQHETHLNKDAL